MQSVTEENSLIDKEDLELLADAATFNKGVQLFNKQAVMVEKQNNNKISGLVLGSKQYRVSITHHQGSYGFSCECPAFSYMSVCKHCVAMALSWSEMLEAQQTGASASSSATSNSSSQSDQQATKDDALMQYIRSLPEEKLVQSLYDIVCHDKRQYTRWLEKARLAAKPQSFTSLKKGITKALPLKDLWDYHKVQNYFETAELKVADIVEASATLLPEEQLKLVLQVYERLNKVLLRIDDSYGLRFDLESRVADALPAIIKRQPWTADEKAEWLGSMLMSDFGSFPQIPDDFALSDSEMAAFLAHCQTRFDEIKVETNIAKRTGNYLLLLLGDILLKHLPQAQDFSHALKIKAKVVSNMEDALALSQFCLDNNEVFFAEDWLIQAKKLCSSVYDERTWCQQAIAVYIGLEETQKAWDIAWQGFIRLPDYDAWLSLQRQTTLIGWAPDSLESDVESAMTSELYAKQRKQYFVNPDDIVRFYLSSQQWQKAKTWLAQNKAGKTALIQAIKAFVERFPSEAIAYTKRALLLILQHSDKRYYQEAVSILETLQRGLPSDDIIQSEFAALVQQIATENSRRPNMMALLRGHFQQHIT